MTLFDPSSEERWLFCMTHPDDEISICAWIRRLTDAGVNVSLSWTHCTPRRMEEARKAAKWLGVPQDRLHFFHALDGRVVDSVEGLIEPFERMMRQVAPTRVACGAFEHGHLDHDATNFLVNATFDGPVLEIPFYHSYLTRLQTINRFSDPTSEEILTLHTGEQHFKNELSKEYPSQNIRRVLWWYEVWQGVRFKPLVLRKSERMRLQSHHDFMTPQAPEPMASAILASAQWARWRAAIKPLAHRGLPR